MIDSLLITARRAGLDSATWLEDVLRRIPTSTTANLHEPLPGNGKPATTWHRRCGIGAHEPAIFS